TLQISQWHNRTVVPASLATLDDNAVNPKLNGVSRKCKRRCLHPNACASGVQLIDPTLRRRIVMKRDELSSPGNALSDAGVSRTGTGRHSGADEVDAEQPTRQRTNAVNHNRQTGRRLARPPKHADAARLRHCRRQPLVGDEAHPSPSKWIA